MPKFKSGDRVRILEGHPYSGIASTGTVRGRDSTKIYRGKWEVDVDDYGASLHFKSRELELLVADKPPLKLEAGKFYKLANGETAGPAAMRGGYFSINHYHYRPDGSCAYRGGPDINEDWRRQYDVMSEAEDPATAEVNAVKAAAPEPADPRQVIGVRLLRVTGEIPGVSHLGEIVTVVEKPAYVDKASVAFTKAGVEVNWEPADHFVLMPAPTTDFIIARMVDGQPRPSQRPFVHDTLESATAEARRLANLHGDEFAVYQRIATESIDAGPVPGLFYPANAQAALEGKHAHLNAAFIWDATPWGADFWEQQYYNGLTTKGRAILKKWLAQSSQTEQVAA